MTLEPTPLEPTQPVQPQPVQQPAKRKSGGNLVNLALGIAVVVAIGGVAFAVGRTTAPAAASGFNGRPGAGLGAGQFPTGSGAPNFGGQGGFVGGGRTITGTVASITDDTITITTANGQTLELTLGSETTYSTKTPAASSDVTTGSIVEVQLDFGGGGGAQNGGAAPSGPIGTAGSVTVVP